MEFVTSILASQKIDPFRTALCCYAERNRLSSGTIQPRFTPTIRTQKAFSLSERARPLRRSDEETGKIITSSLALVIIAFAVFALVSSIVILIHVFSPIPFWDQWFVIGLLRPGQFTLANLWDLHNEHRYLIGRLLALADIVLFKGQSLSLHAEVFAFQTWELLVFTWLIRRFTHLSRPILISLFGVLLYCVFSPLQMENFVWSWQSGFVLVSCAASTCFASALWYAIAPQRRNTALAICLLTALIAEASLANGLLVWPLLLFMGLALGFRKRDLLLILGVAAAAIAAYFPGYHTPPLHAHPTASVQHPLELLKFMVTYLASSWDIHLPNTSAFPLPSESLTFLAIVGTVTGFLSCLRRQETRAFALRTFLFTNMVFILGTALVTALGRLNFGYVEATSSRYQTFALVFWACAAVWGAILLNELWAHWRVVAATQVFVLALLLGTPPRYYALEQIFALRKAELFSGYEDLARGDLKSPAIPKLFSIPQRLPGYLQILRAYGAEPRLGTPELLEANIRSYHITPAAACTGHVDRAAYDGPPGYAVTGGWAWNLLDHKAPQRMVVVSKTTGTIAGWNWPSVPRPDVTKINPNVNADVIGFNISFHANGPGPYAVYALFGHDHLACQIGSDFLLQ
jgi:hypothetical protein